ncbi:EamA family transporter [Candidatus Woesearchaeota archaeon]|nr:EamA family transporter [Candidatus Woesearchaeota archaeon]
MNLKNKGILAILLAAFIWGSGGVLVRVLNNIGLNFYTFNFYIMLAGTVALYLSSKFSKDNNILNIKKNEFKYFIMLGVILSLAIFTVNFAFLYTKISNAAFLNFTSSIFIMIVGVIIFKERLTLNRIFALILAIIAIVLITNFSLINFNLNKGDLSALASALVFTSYHYIGKKLKNTDEIRTIFWTTLIATIILLPFYLINISWTTSIFIAIGIFLLEGILHTATAHRLYLYALRNIEISKAGILYLFQPISASLFALVFLNEIPSLKEFIGVLLIIISIFIISKD